MPRTGSSATVRPRWWGGKRAAVAAGTVVEGEEDLLILLLRATDAEGGRLRCLVDGRVREYPYSCARPVGRAP
ncbi:hypothetical protein GCM10010260_27470 [Streptomyces filipinensis]|uniref:Uncharacterized protein n=1 Tax=Streptomyces filipinensis TaxID=66887 RepID=A0A918I9I6_9ACTN|nr:hypothetical protein [Streptomyces filipinensis]GGU91572.1 hypothetical protein GCM10010260_27470 [Streptomyces filipinensis]